MPNYAGPAPGYLGLDQVNLLLPTGLAQVHGEVNVTLRVSTTTANTVTIPLA